MGDIETQHKFFAYRFKRFCTTLFLTYLLLVFYLTLFTFNHYVYGKSVNLKILNSIQLMIASGNPLLILKNVIGNVFLFFPFGFLAALLSKRMRKFWISVPSGFFLSLLIESCQYHFAQRIFDVDDLLLNTLGTILGWVAYKLVKTIFLFNRKGS